MRQTIWRKWLWTAAITAALAGCILNPQPEPPGNTSNPSGNYNGETNGGGQATSTAAGNGYNVGAGGANSSFGGSVAVALGGGAVSGATGGMASGASSATSAAGGAASTGGRAALAGATSTSRDAGTTVGGSNVVCANDAGSGGDFDASSSTAVCTSVNAASGK